VSRSGSTNHADSAERTADVGSPDRDVGRSAASCSQRLQSDRWSETRHRRTPELETSIEVCRIPAHTLLESLTGGARQDCAHCITAHPFLERVTGGAKPDITAHPSVRHQSWSATKSHTSHNGAEHGSVDEGKITHHEGVALVYGKSTLGMLVVKLVEW